MYNYLDVPGVKFIVNRPFDTEYGHHDVGEEFKEAWQIYNTEVLVSAGFLYPYAPGNGYDYLPPHLFSLVSRKEEVEAKMAGDPSGERGVDQFPDSPKPDVVKQAETEAEIQQKLYPQLLAQAAANQRRVLAAAQPDGDVTNPLPTTPLPAEKQEEVAKQEAKEEKDQPHPVAKKAAVKKTVAPVRKTATRKVAVQKESKS